MIRSYRINSRTFRMTASAMMMVMCWSMMVPLVYASVRSEAEQWKINALLHAIQEADVHFMRNGKIYTASEAYEHLSHKLLAAGSKVQTVQEFIEKIASRSSLSGENYQVVLTDGKTIPASVWLHAVVQ